MDRAPPSALVDRNHSPSKGDGCGSRRGGSRLTSPSLSELFGDRALELSFWAMRYEHREAQGAG